jgi:hypothetical protein
MPCRPGFLDESMPFSEKFPGIHLDCLPGERVERHDMGTGGKLHAQGMKDPCPDKKDLCYPRYPGSFKRAAEHLARLRGPPPCSPEDRLVTFRPEDLHDPREHMRVLGGGDDADSSSFEERECRSHHGRIDVYPVRQMQNGRVGDEGGMAEVNEHIGILEQAKREVAGAIAGIPADNDREPLAFQGIRDLACLPLQTGRELESER